MEPVPKGCLSITDASDWMTVLFVLTGGNPPHQPGNLQRFFGGFHATKNHGKPKAIKVNRLGGNPERAEITRKPSTDLFVDCRVVGKTPKFECGFSDVLFKDVLRVIYASPLGVILNIWMRGSASTPKIRDRRAWVVAGRDS